MQVSTVAGADPVDSENQEPCPPGDESGDGRQDGATKDAFTFGAGGGCGQWVIRAARVPRRVDGCHLASRSASHSRAPAPVAKTTANQLSACTYDSCGLLHQPSHPFAMQENLARAVARCPSFGGR